MTKDFVQLVQDMREAQKNYFRAAAKARKSRKPEDFADSKEYLSQSKELEAKVDLMIHDIQVGG